MFSCLLIPSNSDAAAGGSGAEGDAGERGKSAPAASQTNKSDLNTNECSAALISSRLLDDEAEVALTIALHHRHGNCRSLSLVPLLLTDVSAPSPNGSL